MAVTKLRFRQTRGVDVPDTDINQGSIFYRDQVAWKSLPPASSTGYVLKSLGSNNNPAWDLAYNHVHPNIVTNVHTITAANSPYTVNGDSVLICNCTNGNITLNLPDATTCPGRIYHIKKIDSTGSHVTIDAYSTQTIDGVLTKVIKTQYASFTLVSDGSNWFII